MSYIPAGSLAFSGYGDAPMKFHSPAGVDLGAPASNPKLSPASSGCDGLVTLADGTFCATRVDGGALDFFTTYTLDAQLAGIVGGTTGTGPWSIASNYSQHFYAYLAPFAGNYSLKKFDAAGALVTSFDLGFNFFPSAGPIGVAPDESAAYYSKRSTASDPVRQCDLAGGSTTFATETGFSLFDNAILVLANGDVLVGWKQAGVDGYVKHYDASGALLHTYTLSGTHQAPLCLTPGLTNTSFWISFYAAGVVTASGVRVAEIELGSGTVLHTFDPDDGAGFEYDGPFCVVRVDIDAPSVSEAEDPCRVDTLLIWGASRLRQDASVDVHAPFGARAIDDPRQRFDIHGFAVPFEMASYPLVQHAGERYIVAPGSFAEAIRRGLARLTVNHEFVVASQRAGNLVLWEDAGGLHFAADLLSNVRTRLLRRHILCGIDSGFIKHICVLAHECKTLRSGLPDVRVTRVDRFDVALLVDALKEPSFPGTYVRVK